MNFIQRFAYFFFGTTLGVIAVIFIANKKNIKFPYGPDARTLKSIRIKKHYVFSSQAQKTVTANNIDSIAIQYLLTESDVDFSKSDTDTSKPCQTYVINGHVKNMEVSLTVARCDSTAIFQEINLKKK